MKLPGFALKQSLSVAIGVDRMDLGLKNRTALVTGSSRGIGLAIAERLLQEGCHVCLTGRNESNLLNAKKRLACSYGDCVSSYCGDFTKKSVIDSALHSLSQEWKSLDCVVANIGNGRGNKGWDPTEEEWECAFNVNFYSAVRLAQAALPALFASHGSLLFIASIVALEATPAPLAYSASKSALVHYSKSLARTVAKEGVRVNCIAPGNILFPESSWQEHIQHDPERVRQMLATDVPQQRFGSPDEIASAAAFLLSPVSNFTCGACWRIDGGQTRSI